MKNLLHRLTTWIASPQAFPWVLLGICLAAYAPFLPRLGFYWDDYPINWIASTMGGEGLARYFATNRPVWGLLYRLTTPILGSQPLAWQIAALLLRWASGLAFWGLLRLAWPKHHTFAAWAALLFVIYPGFSQQPIAFLYSHFYIILILFLLSFCATLLALHAPRYFWPLTLAALAASAYQLMAMEYFFLLELLRPVLVWLKLGDQHLPWQRRLARTALLWLPYLAILAGVMVWRSLFFGFHTYQPTLMSRLRADPLPALFELAGTALSNVWMVVAGAWVRAFQVGLLPAESGITGSDLQRYALMGATLVAFLVYGLLILRASRTGGEPGARAWLWQPLGVGVAALFIAGGPFWLTDLQIGLLFPNDRFTLSFIFGASLVTAALLSSLPRPQLSGGLLLAIGLAAAVGVHFANGSAYRQDWSRQRSFFWQMVWRAPALQPGTVLLSNDLPLGHYTDNSLSAPINWIYDPQNDPARMSYILYYPTLRGQTESWLADLQPGQEIQRDYLATTFYGNTSQVVTLVYNPPGCLRILDPEIETVNWMTPQYLRETLTLATLNPILAKPAPGQSTAQMLPQLFGTEPAHNWCYYFEKADLASQQDDWQQVVDLAVEAFASGDYPNDPAERLPFIEGYAHTGDWQRALELSAETRTITPAMQPVLCRLWQRIGHETTVSPEQQSALQEIQAIDACTW